VAVAPVPEAWRCVMVPLLKELKAKPNLGLLFSDIEVTE